MHVNDKHLSTENMSNQKQSESSFDLTQYKCGRCEKSFTVKSDLVAHINDEHCDEETYGCDHCKKDFNTKHDLTIHSCVLVQNYPYKCSRCEEKFISENQLAMHVNDKHPNNENINNRKQSESSFVLMQYKCGRCEKSFTAKSDLVAHINNEHCDEETYGCDHCKKDFNSKHDMTRHLCVPMQNYPYKCNRCEEKFTSENQLAMHIDNKHPSTENTNYQKQSDSSFVLTQYKCGRCEKSFIVKSDLVAHINNEHCDEETYGCDHCKKDFNTKHDLTMHLCVLVQNYPYKCNRCEEKFTFENQLMVHVNDKHPNNENMNNQKPTENSFDLTQYKRSRREKSFTAKCDLVAHINNEHCDEKTHGCDHCKKDFNTKLDLTMHSCVPVQNYPYKCNRCEEKFTSENELTMHIDDKHPSTENMNNQKQSESSFDFKDGMRTRLFVQIEKQNHHLPELANHRIDNERMFKCNQCNDSFNLKNDLVVHLRTHIELPPYKCHQCKETFTMRSQFLKHNSEKHDNEKPFENNQRVNTGNSKSNSTTYKKKMNTNVKKQHECNVCKQTFITKIRLAIHVYDKHKTTNIFKCSHCENSFDLEDELKTHLHVHKPKLQHECSRCKETFTTKGQLAVHFKDKHNENGLSCDRSENSRNSENNLSNYVQFNQWEETFAIKNKSVMHVNQKNKFKCNHCKNTFNSKSGLRAHLCARVQKPLHECSDCKETFTSKNQLETHFNDEHNNENKFSCNQCENRFDSESDLEIHLRVHIQKLQHECSRCKDTFATEDQLTAHIEDEHNDDDEFEFDQSENSFSSENDLKMDVETPVQKPPHKSNQSKETLNDECNNENEKTSEKDFGPAINLTTYLQFSQWEEKFAAENQSILYINDNYDESNFKCNQCENSFDSESDLTMHIRVHTHKCSRCEEKFSTKSQLETHINDKHNDENRFKCKRCKRRFSSKKYLMAHEQNLRCVEVQYKNAFPLKNSIVKPVSNKKMYRCDHCKNSFRSQNSLKVHLQVHIQKQRHKCDTCKETFDMKNNLMAHIKEKHPNNANTFKCNQCNDIFHFKNDLMVHLHFHSQKSPTLFHKHQQNSKGLYKCGHCESKFISYNCLMTHLRIHGKMPPYKCNLCRETFAVKQNLSRHIYDIHGLEEPFKCDQCDHMFSSLYEMKKHIVDKHCDSEKSVDLDMVRNPADKYNLRKRTIQNSFRKFLYMNPEKDPINRNVKDNITEVNKDTVEIISSSINRRISPKRNLAKRDLDLYFSLQEVVDIKEEPEAIVIKEEPVW